MKDNNLDNNLNDDVSMYYPDGDSAHISRDDHDDAFLNQNRKKKERIRKKNARLKKSQIAVIAVVFAIYLLIMCFAAWLIFYRPETSKPNEVPFNTDPFYDDTENDPNKPPLDNESNSGDKESGNVKNEYIAKEGVYNILLIGQDDAASLADVIMLINCNTQDNSISVMQIPRDTLVTIGVLTNKANAAYSTFVGQAYRDGEKNHYVAAVQKFAEMLEQSLCINIHHTAVIKLSGFKNIVNALGGVDIYVPNDMFYEDPEQELYINIPKGYHHFDGYQAECFVRFRSGFLQADLGRVNAQKIFMTAMFNKLKSTIKSVDVATLTSLVNHAVKNVSTDMSVSDIMYYAKFLLNVGLDNVNMLTIPGNIADDYYVINRAATLNAINQYFNIYEKSIPATIFDRDLTFCFADLQYISNVYYAPASNVLDGVYNAEVIDKNSIHIPTKPAAGEESTETSET